MRMETKPRQVTVGMVSECPFRYFGLCDHVEKLGRCDAADKRKAPPQDCPLRTRPLLVQLAEGV
jgi:hypothetical protein